MKTIFTLSIAILLISRVRLWCEHARIVDAGPVTSVDYSPDGTKLLTCTASRVTIWERSTKQILFVHTTTNSKFAKFSTDSPSTYIAISSANSDITIISAVSPFGSIQTFNAGHGGALAAHMDFASATMLVTCGGTNNKLRAWDVSANPATMSLDTTVAQIFTCAALSTTQIGTGASNNKL
jgi:WD40 repeat protein